MMKKLLLIISLLISLAAQAYEPLIREGRVWSYDTVREWDAFPNADVEVTFIGTTEINGIVYHNLVGVHHPDTVISLMREENHKVYRYIADNSSIWEQWQNFMGEEGIARYNEENNCHAGEILLYDFDCVSGKRYETISCGSNGMFTICAPGMITHSDKVMLRDGLHTYYILGYSSSSDVVEIEPFRAVNSPVPIYEGIGPVQGLLDCPGCGPWITGMNDWVTALIKVYDMETEKTVYLAGDNAGYIPMVIEGLRWEYDRVMKTAEGTEQTVGSASYIFTSETQKDGKNYLAFTEETTGEVAAYIRQEGPKVYMWIDPEKSRRPTDEDGKEITENLLYDFSISYKRDAEDYMTKIFYFKYPIYTVSGEKITSFVNELKYERIGLYLCDVQHVELSRGDEKAGTAVFVEGVGPKTGRLFEPLASIDSTNEKFVLRQLTSGDKTRYTKSQMEALYSGVGSINAEEPERDTRMYDLMGREIRNPQRGTIYIRDGEKRIAR